MFPEIVLDDKIKQFAIAEDIEVLEILNLM